MKVTKTEVIEALRNLDGIVSEVAKSLKVTPEAIRLRIKKYPELQAAQNEARETLVDRAESQLRKAVDNGAAWATKFVLETWGKSRGFTKRIQVESGEEPRGVMHLHFPDDGRDKPDPSNALITHEKLSGEISN